MTATCLPLPLILACQDDPFREIPRGGWSASLQCMYGEVVGDYGFWGATQQRINLQSCPPIGRRIV